MVHKIWFNDEKFRDTRPKMIKSMAIYSSTKSNTTMTQRLKVNALIRNKKAPQKTHGGWGFQKFYFSNLLRLELASLRYWCAAQWPILTKLPIFAKIYHPIELIGFSPNLERDLLEDFQITWKLISFISPRAFDEEEWGKYFESASSRMTQILC